MASRGYIENEKIKLERENKDKELKQRERESRRAMASNIIGSSIKAFPSKLLLNDPSWYKQWIDDKDFTGIPAVSNTVVKKNIITGFAATVSGQVANNINDQTTPVVVGLLYAVRLGRARGTSSYLVYPSEFPANTGWMKDLMQIAKVNSRAVSQDPDVMGLYVLQVMEIARCLAYIRTNLQIVSKFSSNQFELRNALLKARGYANPNLIIDSYADWVKLYETYAKRFNEEIVIPGDLPLLKRRIWLDSAVIRDHAYHKSQYITFEPYAFGTWDSTNSYIGYTASISTVSAARTLLDNWFALITTDVDFQTLVGNMRAAIPVSKLAVLPLDIGELQVIDAEVNCMHQFRNIVTLPEHVMTLADATSRAAFFQITTDGTNLTQGCHLDYSCYRTSTLPSLAAMCHSKLDQIFHFYSSSIDSDLVLEATRLHPKFVLTGTSGTDSNGDACFTTARLIIQSEGTEVILKAKVFAYSLASGYVSTDVYSFMTGYSATAVASNVNTHLASAVSTLRAAALLTNFDWGFDVYFTTDDSAQGSGATATTYTTRLNGEIANYAELSAQVMSDINDIAVRSEYFIADSVFSDSHIR